MTPTTWDLIERAVALLDDRAMAAFGVPEPDSPEDRPDGMLATSTDERAVIGRLLSGTDLDVDHVNHYLKGARDRTVLDVASHPPTHTGLIIEGMLRAAFLTGYHVRRLQQEADNA